MTDPRHTAEPRPPGLNAERNVRALLVEFVTPDRFHGSSFFPFVQALLRRSGAEVRWLRWGLEAAIQLTSGEDGMSLPPDEAAALAAAANEHGATHVLYMPHPAPSLAARLAAVLPGCRQAVLSDVTEDDDEATVMVSGVRVVDGALRVPPLAATPEALADWAGLAQQPEQLPEKLPEHLVEAPAPDYEHEDANPLARAATPFVHLFAGPGCTHLRPLTDCAFFRDRELSELPAEATERWGCSFCMVPTWDVRARQVRTAPQELLDAQLAGIARSHPRDDRRLRYKVGGARVALRPAALAEAAERHDLPAGDWLLDLRADQVVRLRSRLEEAARRLRARGHRLHVFLVGIESFSARQLDRYAKGYPPATNLAAIRALRELEAQNPDAFGFRAYGGLSTILFDPWVDLSELALNLAVVAHFDLEPLTGKLHGSRMRLQDGLPLTAAARVDGLLLAPQTAADSDPALETARRNFYGNELPWRFADPRLEPVNQLMARVEPDPALAGDPLYERVQAWPLGTLARSRAIVAAATATRDRPAPLAADELLHQAIATAPHAPSDRGPEGSRAVGKLGATLDEDALESLTDVAAFRACVKPVLKLEGSFSPEDADRIEATVATRWPDSVLRRRPRPTAQGEVELFVSREAALVDEAVRMTALSEDSQDPQAVARAVARVGELLGYPPCCSDAFSRAGAPFQANNEWLRVRRRVEHAGPVDPLLHPVMTSYVPCRLDCPQALSQANQLKDDPPGGLPLERLRYPTLLFLERPGDFAMLRPLGEMPDEPRQEPSEAPGYRFRYELSNHRSDDPRIAALQRGDTILIEPGLVRIFSSGSGAGEQELGWFAMDAFVWWHAQVFHPEFWAAAVQHLVDPPTPPTGDSVGDVGADGDTGQDESDESDDAETPAAEAGPPPDPDASRRAALRAAVEELFRRLEASPRRHLRGFRAESVTDRRTGEGWGELTVALVRGDARLHVRILPRETVRHGFALTPHYAIMHDDDTPADTDEKRALLHLTGRALERFLHRTR